MIHFDMPYAEYRAHQALGSTDLKNILRSPAHFRHARLNQKSSKALDFGRAVHSYLLERDTFFNVFAVEPEGLLNKAKNPWKAEWDKFKAMCKEENKTVLAQEDWHAVKGIAHSIKTHKWASKIMERSRFEVSAFNDKLKARADILSDAFIFDLKTCLDIREFLRDIQKHQYYMQGADYHDVFQSADGRYRKFGWIACEKEAPFCIKVFVANEDMIEMGRREYKAALEIYERCVANNEWPGYEDGIEELELKPFFKGVLS